PGASSDYDVVTYQTLVLRARHHCSCERRMRTTTAYHARERAVARAARDIIGPRDPTVRRVVFFGKAEFGSGSRGPIPCKRLIRQISCLVLAALTDEYCTSMTCPQDRAPLHRSAMGSRVFCCANARPEDAQCNVHAIDRDHAGTVNILMCGVALNRALPPQQHCSAMPHMRMFTAPVQSQSMASTLHCASWSTSGRAFAQQKTRDPTALRRSGA
ncbi:hypothetical protein JKP88DRAFT_254472, partial [Tribonema minus]